MGTVSANFLPNTTGLDLGATNQRWDGFIQNLDIAGTISFSGGLSGLTTISTSGSITTAAQLVSTVATGTAPLAVSSTTAVANLNSSLLLGSTWASPAAIGSSVPAAGSFTTLSATGQLTSTVSTGSAPLVVASTTQVSNLNVSQLVGATWAIPASIGSTTPANGSFTTLSGSTSLTVGAGTAITKIVVYTSSLAPSSVAANTTAEQTFTINGLTTADIPVVVKPTQQAGLTIGNARVSASNTLALQYINATASPIVPTTESYSVIAFRS